MILLTGGCGFIGTNLVRLLLSLGHEVLNLDKLTYAGCSESLEDVADNPGYHFLKMDICDISLLKEVFVRYRPAKIFHLAAESHVDRSIDGPDVFVQTNIIGTFNLLKTAYTYWTGLSPVERKSFRFAHISTDEVFGSLGMEGYFTEENAYVPRSPYSASKASADHLVQAYHSTYGFPTLITNASNNYGPYQFPEKLIPLTISSALSGRQLPVYGNGSNIRDWLYVEDHCRALLTVLEQGIPGERYNVGGDCERTNLQVVSSVCDILDEIHPRQDGQSYSSQIAFVQDRPGHDFRYAVCTKKIRQQMNWAPLESFDSGLRRTVAWYLENRIWWQRITEREDVLNRQGLNCGMMGGGANDK